MFDAALSGANLSDHNVIHVPNIGFISAIPNVKRMGFLAEIGLKTAITMAKPKEFHDLKVKDFLFGVEDDFVNLISKVKWDLTKKDVCVLGYRDGLLKRKYTVDAGLNDSTQSCQFKAVNDKPSDNMWTTAECNEIKGSDLAVYNNTAIRNKQELFIFLPELHRAISLDFTEKVKICFFKFKFN